jgi:hypothetical protein
VLEGTSQVKLTCDEDVFVSSLVNEVGAFGTLGIFAPFPVDDSNELPREFYATTFAITEAPYARENGDARRIVAGIEQAVFDFTVALLRPSQLIGSVVHEVSCF